MSKLEQSPKALNTTIIVLSSLILPGLGQFLTKRRGRGFIIFIMTIIQVYLIDWSLVHQNFGKITPGGLVTSWLWLPLILFWVWNVSDARALAVKKAASPAVGFLLAAIILYVIAWNVTDVRLDRLVQRFSDARTVATKSD